MRKFVKYLTLSLCSIFIAIILLVFILLLLDIPTLNHKTTMILPSFCILSLIAALVSLIVLAFKFSDHKPIKNTLVITLILFLLSGVFKISGNIINPLIYKDSVVLQMIDNVSFDIPSNWDKKVSADGKYSYFYTPNNDFLMYFNTPIEYGLNDITFDGIVNGMMSGIENFEKIENGTKEIGLNTFYYIKNSGMMNNEEYVFETYAVHKDGVVHLFEMISKGTEYKYTEAMSKIIQSVIVL